jgi:hypothetical protein
MISNVRVPRPQVYSLRPPCGAAAFSKEGKTGSQRIIEEKSG